MGIQTFNDDILSLLKRRHNAQQAIEAFGKCRNAGFRNISIDLMYGLPGESMDTWNKDLDTAISLKPEHISAYHLIYEEGTVLYKLREENKVREAGEDLSNSLFETLISRMKENGYVHYEISNFCRPGMHSRHNSSYWTGINRRHKQRFGYIRNRRTGLIYPLQRFRNHINPYRMGNATG